MSEKIRTIFIDIETYSGASLAECGVYKYAGSNDFEILLFGYSLNGNEVKVADIAQGEKIPEQILEALTDDTVLKWSHNANFERVCLSAWLKKNYPQYFKSYSTNEDTVGDYLDPASWRCSQILCACMGLPLSLEGAGAVLGLDEQKMKEGKDLIKYFCQPCSPTKTNGGRIRNLPKDAPDEWELFKSYNKRDVEVEMSIQQKLQKFLVPDSIWEEYALDQEINDRGILVDLDLVRNAVRFDALSRDALTTSMKKKTGMDNPNSVIQMKQWLKDKGMEVESLGKKEVAELIKTAPSDLAEVLKLRQQLSKSSVKKYQKMEQVACADGRARGMYQFYGANRTGRWCLAEGSPVLVKDLNGKMYEKPVEDVDITDLVFDGENWVRHEGVVYSGEKDVITWDGITATPEHKVFIDESDSVPLSEAKERKLPIWNGNNKPVSDNKICSEPADSKGNVHMKTYDIINAGPNNRFMVNGRVVSNSGRQIQLQNLPRNTLPDLAEARSVVKSGEYELMSMLYDDVPDTLSQLIRTAFVPRPGYKFIVADFSSIEARVLAYLAKEQWRIDAFANGEDIYAMSASVMFGVPVEKHGQNSALRQKGKIAELACIAGGSLVLTDRGEIPIQYVTKDERVWDGRHWVSHGGVVFKGFRPIIHYDGLSATADHLVYVNTQTDPIEFGEAVRRRLPLRKKNRKGYVPDFYRGFAPVYDIVDAGAKHRFTVSGCLVHNCGYGGSVGALKKMGALEMGLSEEELRLLVNAWRTSNPRIVQLWWDIDKAFFDAVKQGRAKTHGISFTRKDRFLFITLPSGRRLAYANPRIERNCYGNECATYEGISPAKKWMRLESYGPKFTEQITQGISRDILAYAMKTLRNCFIVGHVHDELIIECSRDVSVDAICEQMGKTPPWMPGLQIRADGYECDFYQKG